MCTCGTCRRSRSCRSSKGTRTRYPTLYPIPYTLYPIPQVPSRLMRPTVGPYALPRTSLGSILTPSPLKAYGIRDVPVISLLAYSSLLIGTFQYKNVFLQASLSIQSSFYPRTSVSIVEDSGDVCDVQTNQILQKLKGHTDIALQPSTRNSMPAPALSQRERSLLTTYWSESALSSR